MSTKFNDVDGIVRLTERELADQKWSRQSHGELTPFGERGGAILLEDIAAVVVHRIKTG